MSEISSALEISSAIPLQQLRKALEADYGEGCAATVIVQGPDGKVLQFISHTSAIELAQTLKDYGAKLGS